MRSRLQRFLPAPLRRLRLPAPTPAALPPSAAVLVQNVTCRIVKKLAYPKSYAREQDKSRCGRCACFTAALARLSAGGMDCDVALAGCVSTSLAMRASCCCRVASVPRALPMVRALPVPVRHPRCGARAPSWAATHRGRTSAAPPCPLTPLARRVLRAVQDSKARLISATEVRPAAPPLAPRSARHWPLTRSVVAPPRRSPPSSPATT